MSCRSVCKEFYESPLLVGNCLGKIPLTECPGSQGPAVAPTHSYSGAFGTISLSLSLLEDACPVLPGVKISSPRSPEGRGLIRAGAWSN